MAERLLMEGTEAICRGAIQAGCEGFFGYPITPQNEIPEFMSREMPKLGRVFVQSESEAGSIYMVYGGALAGKRVMTSTSSPGFSLMQEGISFISEAEVPAVVVEVTRMGPGIGTTQQGQTDYRQVTKGGGHGAYRCIVLAPYTPQECFDHVQLAFHLAEKHKILSLVLGDFIICHMTEPVEVRTLSFEDDLPEKDWALTGKGKKDGKRAANIGAMFKYGGPPGVHQHLTEKYQRIKDTEIRYEDYKTEDAELLLVAYGSSGRAAKGAVNIARAEGINVGLLRPITLWPFPDEAVKEAACRAGKVLVVEDSPGELVEDVQFAVLGEVPVHLLGIWGRHTPQVGGLLGGASGLIYPERIVEEVKNLI
ncbi:MAG: 3-methyl-2-oxobutanoate dehydrogenase subunit VorB [Thermodesulfobacteriota bacterium]|nr:3-methyl-2-oxobutanoate dehydrogenase subunit VorB [Thermodesulfobacteriota bacterium]